MLTLGRNCMLYPGADIERMSGDHRTSAFGLSFRREPKSIEAVRNAIPRQN